MQKITLSLIALLTISPVVFGEAENSQVVFDETYFLEVPLADFQGRPGFYQHAVFEMEQDGDWKLLAVHEGVPVAALSLGAVEVLTTSELPIQVFLKVEGELSSGCAELGEFAVSRSGNDFNVFLYYSEDFINSLADLVCADVMVPFIKMIPLPVYGLDAGEYGFSINDVLFGEFVIPAANIIPE